jgi:hypothetical protein
MTEQNRTRLRELRGKLLQLHKVLLDDARASYEMDRGRIASNASLLQLVINDPWFAWLHSLSELVVRIDETVETDSPATDADAATLIDQVEKLLTASETGEGFHRRYYDALQRQPAVVMAHAEVRHVGDALDACYELPLVSTEIPARAPFRRIRLRRARRLTLSRPPSGPTEAANIRSFDRRWPYRVSGLEIARPTVLQNPSAGCRDRGPRAGRPFRQYTGNAAIGELADLPRRDCLSARCSPAWVCWYYAAGANDHTKSIARYQAFLPRSRCRSVLAPWH